MLFNIALIFIISIFFSKLFEKIKLPGLLGMLLTGILLGKYAKQIIQSLIPEYFFNHYLQMIFIPDKLLEISPELRTLALIVILTRAGLGISRQTLNKIGPSALKMSFIPCILEGSIILIVAHYLVGLSFIESGILGFTLAAVSPAVVVPAMLGLKEHGYGHRKEIPTIILAGSSIDDVFAITLFGVFLDMTMVKAASAMNSIGFQLLKIPISIITGISIGLICGYLLIKYFKKADIRDTRKVLKFFIIAMLLYQLQETRVFPFASLLGVMAMGFIILEMDGELANRLSSKFAKIWVFAEIILFVFIGAEFNLTVVGEAGLAGAAVIGIGLLARSLGVFLSLFKSGLNFKEMLFCAIAYIPKATVQAAIGGVALNMVTGGKITLSNGIATGELILAIAVLSIVITAPLGAIAIKVSAKHLLEKGEIDLTQ